MSYFSFTSPQLLWQPSVSSVIVIIIPQSGQGHGVSKRLCVPELSWVELPGDALHCLLLPFWPWHNWKLAQDGRTEGGMEGQSKREGWGCNARGVIGSRVQLFAFVWPFVCSLACAALSLAWISSSSSQSSSPAAPRTACGPCGNMRQHRVLLRWP